MGFAGCFVDENNNNRKLPLEKINLHSEITEYCAFVNVEQCCVNKSDKPVNLRFEFVLPHSAVVCGFSALINDDENVVCHVKEKEEAHNEFKDAVENGKAGVLLENNPSAPNVFTVKLGNLMPGKPCVATFQYAIECELRENKIVFEAPSVFESSESEFTKAGEMSLTADIQMSKEIIAVECPAALHDVEINENKAKFTLLEPDLLTSSSKQIAILITLDDPFVPTVVKAVSDKDTNTFMASFYPNIENDKVYAEIIFVVDQSGSMSGSKNKATKAALELFLKSLPESSRFNIVAFGSHYKSLFEQSVPYTQEHLDTAMEFVNRMKADMSCTDIGSPMKHVLDQPIPKGFVRQVLLLTDGEENRKVHDTVTEVAKCAGSTRVFTFGLGGDADAELITAVAKAGRGECVFIKDSSEVEEKVMLQVNRVLVPSLSNITVTWNLPGAVPAPEKFTPLIWGEKVCAYALLDGKVPAGEASVTIEGWINDKKFTQTAEFDTGMNSIPKSGRGVVALAVHNRLKDLEKDKEACTALSIKEDVLSKYTSFVGQSNKTVTDKAAKHMIAIDLSPLKKHQPVPEVCDAFPMDYCGFASRRRRGQPRMMMRSAKKKMAAAPRAMNFSLREQSSDDDESFDDGIFDLMMAAAPCEMRRSDMILEERRQRRFMDLDVGCCLMAQAAPPVERYCDVREPEVKLSSEEVYRAIIRKQQANGSWNIHDILDILHHSISIDGMERFDPFILGTAFVLALIRSKYRNKLSILKGIISKAEIFLQGKLTPVIETIVSRSISQFK